MAAPVTTPVPSLLDAPRRVPDGRGRRGRRYTQASLLSFAVCAMLCGARSLSAIAQWGRDQAADDIRAALAAGVQARWRGHRGIEHRLHDVRDVTLGEDARRMRRGNEPQALAAVRTAVISTVRRAGQPNIAAAVRTYAGKPRPAPALIGLL